MSEELPRTLGPYTLLRLLSRGGMGEIFLASQAGHAGFEKLVAVKRLMSQHMRDADAVARFIDEAKLGSRLQHPNVISIATLERIEPDLFMAMEFIDGFDLRRVLRTARDKRVRIPVDIALFIVREMLTGLAYAHRQVDSTGASLALIHRDVSPQNVLVGFEGEVKIGDFGLAKSTQRSHETQANVLIGNLGYMSPEQAQGQSLDVRTDVFSAGIVLFELLTGTKRYHEPNPLQLLEAVAQPMLALPGDRIDDIPDEVDAIAARALAMDKSARFDGAQSFADAVTSALHTLSPRFTRGALARFMRDLFLPGEAPAPMDGALLDRSRVIKAQALGQMGFDEPSGPIPEPARVAALTETAKHAHLRAVRFGSRIDDVPPPPVTNGDGEPSAVADEEVQELPSVDAEAIVALDAGGDDAPGAHPPASADSEFNQEMTSTSVVFDRSDTLITGMSLRPPTSAEQVLAEGPLTALPGARAPVLVHATAQGAAPSGAQPTTPTVAPATQKPAPAEIDSNTARTVRPAMRPVLPNIIRAPESDVDGAPVPAGADGRGHDPQQ